MYKYVTKQTPVQAIQIPGQSFKSTRDEFAEFCSDRGITLTVSDDGGVRIVGKFESLGAFDGNVGDWIVYYGNSIARIYTNDVFQNKFEQLTHILTDEQLEILIAQRIDECYASRGD